MSRFRCRLTKASLTVLCVFSFRLCRASLCKYHLSNQNSKEVSEREETQIRSSPRYSNRDQLELVTEDQRATCGRVPIFEKIYQQSIGPEQAAHSGNSRILFGNDAVLGEWPWAVRVSECFPNGCNHCTGVLLNSRWVITAGHCVSDKSRNVSNFRGALGLYDLVVPDKSSTDISFDRLIVHPDYDNLDNDLTLLRLRERVQFNEFVQPVCLVEATRDVVSFTAEHKCYTLGYGLIDDFSSAHKMQKLQIEAKEPSECNNDDEINTVKLRQGTVCIGPISGSKGGSCRGDSGGPNMCYNEAENKWYVFATVSYGPKICERESGDKWLTVSVDLTKYRTWILSTIAANR